MTTYHSILEKDMDPKEKEELQEAYFAIRSVISERECEDAKNGWIT